MVLVTGATGFLGRALIRRLREEGRPVRALVRDAADRTRLPDPAVALAVGDVLDRGSMYAALNGVSAVYYLVHAMGRQRQEAIALEELERRGIENLITACRHRGVDRVIYQGGLSESPDAGSAHLRARWQVEAALRASDLNYTVFRAGMIIGRGSVSFEVLYRVVRDLPIVPLFGWTDREIEPVALPDLLEILVSSLDEPRTFRRTFDVGGCERMTYEQLCRKMADVLGRRPVYLPIPFVATRVTALGIMAATRIPFRQAIHLAPSLKQPLVRAERCLDEIFPGSRMSFVQAIEAALAEPAGLAEPLWNPAELLELSWRLPLEMLGGSWWKSVRQLPETTGRWVADARLLWDPE